MQILLTLVVHSSHMQRTEFRWDGRCAPYIARALLKFILQFDWHFWGASSYLILRRSLSPIVIAITCSSVYSTIAPVWSVCFMAYILLVFIFRIRHLAVFTRFACRWVQICIRMLACYGSHFINRKVEAIISFDNVIRRWRKTERIRKFDHKRLQSETWRCAQILLVRAMPISLTVLYWTIVLSHGSHLNRNHNSNNNNV